MARDGIHPVHRIEKMPFTVYDVVGYLAPGFFVVYALTLVFFWGMPVNVKPFLIFEKSGYLGEIVFAVFYTTFCYVVGHVTSFLSSITIERASINYFGYPSYFVLNPYHPPSSNKPGTVRAHIATKRQEYRDRGNRFGSAILSAFCAPIHIAIWICDQFGWLRVVLKRHSNTNFIVQRLLKEFSQKTRGSIRREDLIYENVSSEGLSEESNREWFRSVDAWVTNNNSVAAARMYNYVVIYGFLRNMCFIFVFLLWAELINFVFCKFFPFAKGQQITCALIRNYLAEHGFWFLLVMGFTYLMAVSLFLAFVKFYRRYTEEGLMAFVLVSDEPVPPTDSEMQPMPPSQPNGGKG